MTGVAGARTEGLLAEDLGKVHIIGIGGVGMSGVARMMLGRGLTVTGSDAREWPAVAGLRALGARITIGHSLDNLDGIDTVVYSSAIKDDNLELAEAKRRGLRLLHRSEALVVLMAGRRVVAIAGTNGKTTTTSMVTTILQRTGKDPSFVIGGEVGEAGSNAHHGTGDFFVAEADESDRSFLLYSPEVALVTNVEADHLDTYGDLAGVEAAFAEFSGRITPTGMLVTCADDPGGRRLAAAARAAGVTVHTYGIAEDADLRLVDVATAAGSSSYRAVLDGTDVGEVRLPVPGAHMALNSAGALLACQRLEVPVAGAIEALESFPGVRRRFELKGIADGVRVYDEYAYHPSSMSVQLKVLREVAGDGRLIVVFMPLRLSRTNAFMAGITEALALADEVVVMEVHAPGEVRGPGEGGIRVAASIPLPAGRVVFEPSWSAVAPEIVRRSRPGDVVVTMGAPPIGLLGEEILTALAER
jgi:UDP-N-acetylmuramate--alanine ligase